MPNTNQIRTHKVLIIAVDLLCILAAYIGAFYIRFQGFPERNWESFVSLLPWLLLIGLFFISVYELYALNNKHTIWDVLIKILVAVTFMAFLTMAASYLFREFAMPRSIIVLGSAFTVIFMVSWKLLYLKLTRRNVVGHILVIGNDENTQRIMSKINHPMLKGMRVKHIQPSVDIDKITHLFREVDYVLLTRNIGKQKKSQIIYHAMEHKKQVYVIPSLYELLLQRSAVTTLDDTLVMSVKPFGLTWDQIALKRGFDLFASLIMLIFASPIMLIVALLVKLEDPKASVIYKQERVGKNQKPFTIYKFRSMIDGAEKSTGPTLASENDVRITKIGKLIRSTRLDELPQLFNVIKGDMSLVGPRPEREFFTKQLQKQFYHYGHRNTVQPGLTGYAQIMGKYSTDVDDKLRFDLYYIRNYSFWLDILIMLKTIVVLFDKTKAEGAEKKSKVSVANENQLPM